MPLDSGSFGLNIWDLVTSDAKPWSHHDSAGPLCLRPKLSFEYGHALPRSIRVGSATDYLQGIVAVYFMADPTIAPTRAPPRPHLMTCHVFCL